MIRNNLVFPNLFRNYINVKKLKEIAKSIAKKTLCSKKLFHFFYRNNKVVVFVFHDTANFPSTFSSKNDLNTTPENFKKQIELINKYFHIISIDNLVKNTDELDKPSSVALITFDDGYNSLFEFAFPYLDQNAIPATLFVNGEVFEKQQLTSATIDFLSKYSPEFIDFFITHYPEHNPDFAFLYLKPTDLNQFYKLYPHWINSHEIKKFNSDNISEIELSTIGKYKNITLGSHQYEHFCINALTAEEIIVDLKKNKNFLSKFTQSRNVFSVTFGHINEANLELLKNSDFEIVFTENNDYNLKPYKKMLKRVSLPSALSNEKDFFAHMNMIAIKKKLRKLNII